jgi:hypothetical protein
VTFGTTLVNIHGWWVNCLYFREERKCIIAELKMREKALQNEDFPSQAMMDEFLHRQPLPKLDFTWKQPEIVSFIVSINPLTY